MATVRLVRGGEDLAEATLGHGAILGRIPSASLIVDDARVSEAHALVSLRSGALQLLALRRRFSVDGKVVGEATLRPGLRVVLADALELVVDRVTLPETVLGLSWKGGEAPLLHDVARLRIQPRIELSWGLDGPADARLWRVGEGWRVVVGGDAPVPLDLGDGFEVGGVRFAMAAVRLHAGGLRTVGAREPLEIVTFWDTVHVRRHGREPAVLVGRGAQIISELAAAGVPIGWLALAQTLWRDEQDPVALRRRLDAALHRLRAKLAEFELREDLVAADGLGHLELRLEAGDRVEDNA